MLDIIGTPPEPSVALAASRLDAHGHVLAVVLDHPTLGQEDCVERILKKLPVPLVDKRRADLWLILTECFANAYLHGKVSALGIAVRARDKILHIRLWHDPPMPPIVNQVLDRAKSGWLPDYDDPTYFGHGLGYPLLARLSRNVTISTDNTELQFWFEE